MSGGAGSVGERAQAGPNIDEGRPADPTGRALHTLCRALALLGGATLLIVIVLTVVSVSGRAVLGTPVQGDFELVEVLTGFAVFSFLPYCHLMRGNVIADIFLAAAPQWVRSAGDAFGNVLMIVIASVLTWRTTLGGFEIQRDHETTYVLHLPRWWGFPPAVLCLALFTAVCLYALWRDLKDRRR